MLRGVELENSPFAHPLHRPRHGPDEYALDRIDVPPNWGAVAAVGLQVQAIASRDLTDVFRNYMFMCPTGA